MLPEIKSLPSAGITEWKSFNKFGNELPAMQRCLHFTVPSATLQMVYNKGKNCVPLHSFDITIHCFQYCKRKKFRHLDMASLNRSNSAEIRSYSIAFPPLWVSMNSAMVELNAVATSRLHYICIIWQVDIC